MNEGSFPSSAARIQQSWIVVTPPGAMTPAEAGLLVAHLRAQVAATYFVEFTAGFIRIHAFVAPTPGQLPVDLKQKLGGLLVEAAAVAKHPNCACRTSEPWSPV